MARVADFESSKKSTANGNCAAKRVRLRASNPYRGEIPSINRSEERRVGKECRTRWLRAYVEKQADERVLRRLQRDVQERARTGDSAIMQYRATCSPRHD